MKTWFGLWHFNAFINQKTFYLCDSGLSRLFSASVVEGGVEVPRVQPQHSWCCLRGALCMVWAGHCWTPTSALDKYVKFLSTFDFFLTSTWFLKVIILWFVKRKRGISTWECQQGSTRSSRSLFFSPVLLSSKWNLLSFNFLIPSLHWVRSCNPEWTYLTGGPALRPQHHLAVMHCKMEENTV